MTDDELDRLLGTLPRSSPRPGFADRVMARVVVPEAEISDPAPATARRRSLAFAASLVALVAGGVAASTIVMVSHRGTLVSVGWWVASAVSEWIWQGIRDLAATAARWSGKTSLRDWSASLPSLAIGCTIGSLLYVSGCLVLRRLMIAPASQAEYAQN